MWMCVWHDWEREREEWIEGGGLEKIEAQIEATVIESNKAIGAEFFVTLTILMYVWTAQFV